MGQVRMLQVFMASTVRKNLNFYRLITIGFIIIGFSWPSNTFLLGIKLNILYLDMELSLSYAINL